MAAIEFVTELQLARGLCLSVSTVRRWRDTWKATGWKSGTGPRPYKFGKAVRYRISEVEAWAEQQQQSTPVIPSAGVPA
jgi:predicted DNA-binding transcriptional regulator AlpA